ncbi:mobilizable transposon, Xis protein [Flammeovirgaceae bacterium 311]|nr:mobilizable transposon, Xis protein [Flammeovirgaceae bacterium 311]
MNYSRKNQTVFGQKPVPNLFEILFDKIESVEEQLCEIISMLSAQPGKHVPVREEKYLFNVEEAAEFLSISKTLIYILKAQNKIAYRKRGRRLYFTRESLIRYIEEEHEFQPEPELTNQEIVKRYLGPRRKKLGL